MHLRSHYQTLSCLRTLFTCALRTSVNGRDRFSSNTHQPELLLQNHYAPTVLFKATALVPAFSLAYRILCSLFYCCHCLTCAAATDIIETNYCYHLHLDYHNYSHQRHLHHYYNYTTAVPLRPKNKVSITLNNSLTLPRDTATSTEYYLHFDHKQQTNTLATQSCCLSK
jgi:hypothetical protein